MVTANKTTVRPITAHRSRLSSARISSVSVWCLPPFTLEPFRFNLDTACSRVIPSWRRTSSSLRMSSTASSDSNKTPRGPRWTSPSRAPSKSRTRFRTASTDSSNSLATSRKVFIAPPWYQDGTRLGRTKPPRHKGSFTLELRSFVQQKGRNSLDPCRKVHVHYTTFSLGNWTSRRCSGTLSGN